MLFYYLYCRAILSLIVARSSNMLSDLRLMLPITKLKNSKYDVWLYGDVYITLKILKMFIWSSTPVEALICR
jgi:hypothetical protein